MAFASLFPWFPETFLGAMMTQETKEKAMRRAKGFAFLAGFGALLILSAGVRAEVSEGDWLNKEIRNGNAEVKFSELAVKQADSAKVKLFAAKMVAAHKKMGAKLNEAARNLNVTVSTELNKDQTGTIDGLKRLSGVAFDRAYITRIVQDHEKAVKSFENEARKGGQPDLKKLANDALPHLQEHLKEARQIANDLNAK
jgi:putative membrane protein